MVYPRTVTHPSTNRARRRATTLINAKALPLKPAMLTGNGNRSPVNSGRQLISGNRALAKPPPLSHYKRLMMMLV